MNESSLTVPWATTPFAVRPPEPMTGVSVLPGYPSHRTASVPATLAAPWSGQALAMAQPPPVAGLQGMLLT